MHASVVEATLTVTTPISFSCMVQVYNLSLVVETMLRLLCLVLLLC
jgi:hypothetical protein